MVAPLVGRFTVALVPVGAGTDVRQVVTAGSAADVQNIVRHITRAALQVNVVDAEVNVLPGPGLVIAAAETLASE